MASQRCYLAFDLGAESGRAIAGTFEEGRMKLDVLHRFPNGPVQVGETLHWDVLNLHAQIKNGLAACVAKYGKDIASMGTDSWGVDFGLLDRDARLIGNPVHYRDSRTDGMPEALFKIVPRKTVFQRTGIQIMQINTLYQLFSMVRANSPLLEIAETFLPMADLQNFFLTGEKVAEFTLATTSQMYDPNLSDWSHETLEAVGIPARLCPDVVAPGSIVGELRDRIAEENGLRSVPVIAPASHDTAAAVAAVPASGDDWLFCSSGTWSLLGAELNEPMIDERTAQLNFTNEGGVDGTYRFLKNLAGLWIVQECKRHWEREGACHDYAELTRLAEDAAPFKAMINPGAEEFLAPGGMPARVVEACTRGGFPAPQTKGEIVRTALESLALIYRETIESVEEVTGKRFGVLHIVGGGTQNTLLNQFVANATGRVVKTGPVEATAFGNCLMQAIALGDIGSLVEAREIVRNSVEVTTHEPGGDRARWEDAYARFQASA